MFTNRGPQQRQGEFDDTLLNSAIEPLEAIFGIDDLGFQRSKAAINGDGTLWAPAAIVESSSARRSGVNMFPLGAVRTSSSRNAIRIVFPRQAVGPLCARLAQVQ